MKKVTKRQEAHICVFLPPILGGILPFPRMYLDPSMDGSMQIAHTSPRVTRIYQQEQMASS